MEIINKSREENIRLSSICDGISISRRTIQHWQKAGLTDKRKGSEKRVHNKLSASEEHRILEIACSYKYKDNTPYEIVAALAEEGKYIGSTRTYYRVFDRNNIVQIKNYKRSKKTEQVEIKASRSNEILSWDITYLKTAIRGKYYYLYMYTDIWDRYIIAWKIYEEESGDFAKELFKEIAAKNKVSGITLHSDNGSPMISSTFRATLEKLGVIQSFSRPSVSNDNAYSESLFSTLKGKAGYPRSFKSIEEANEWISKFVDWYNNSHKHSGLCYVTPVERRTGKDKQIFEIRNKTFKMARATHPERWTRNTKLWKIDQEVFLKRGNSKRKAS